MIVFGGLFTAEYFREDICDFIIKRGKYMDICQKVT